MKILLVDDETSVIQALLGVLKTLAGHDVRVATSGEKALENAEAMGGLDLLVTDVVMDPMDGFTLQDHLVARYPRLRTIFISGYDLSDYTEQLEGHQFLQKPIEAHALLEAVRQELATIAATQPKPVAVAQPRAVAAAAAGAAVKPVVVAKPVVAGQPVARMTGIPQPRATPAAPGAPRVTAAPRAVGAAPVAQPRAVAPVARAMAVSSLKHTPSGNGVAEGLIGQQIGAYQIVSHLGEGRYGSAYAAVQISINRPVGLKVLDSERAQDEHIKARFIADARAKAHVQHPSVIAVYEAGEADGRIFYAREYVDGQSMAEIAAGGRPLDEQTALKVMRVVAEGFIYFHLNSVPHHPLDATKVFLGMDGHARLANLAVQVADEHLSTELEIQTLGQIMFTVVPGAQILSSQMSVLLSRMIQAQTSGLNSWGTVLQAVKALEPKNIPVEAMKISAQDKAAIDAVEAARKQQRRSLWINVGSLALLFSIVVYLALRKFVFTNERQIHKMVKISAGSYQLPSGKTAQIERDYWIDKYEVTWGQYARFLDYLNKNPTADQDFRHPKMPRYLEHENETMKIYLGRAKAGVPARSIPIDLNCPAMTVTWWDAYAYAKWLGSQTGTERDLPTEEEWEIAASGAKGSKYPWGDEFDPKKANTNSDFKETRPGEKGAVDGFNFWSSVDALGSDKSPFGIVGMGGNLAEWTGTWTQDNRFPIIKGGSYRAGATSNDKRISDHDANKGEEWLGFRTISRTPPPDAE